MADGALAVLALVGSIAGIVGVYWQWRDRRARPVPRMTLRGTFWLPQGLYRMWYWVKRSEPFVKWSIVAFLPSAWFLVVLGIEALAPGGPFHPFWFGPITWVHMVLRY